jgi:hypothetical protein
VESGATGHGFESSCCHNFFSTFKKFQKLTAI